MNPGLIKTFVAGADIGANRIVALDENGRVIPAAGRDCMPIGVVQFACHTGERIDVTMSGIVDVATADNGPSITPGSPIGAGDGGAASVQYGDSQLAGIALESADYGGDLLPMLIAIQHGTGSDPIFTAPVTVSEDVDTGHLVAIVDGVYKTAASPSDKIVGVSAYNARANEEAGIAIAGVIPVVAGESLSVGDYLTADANGQAVVANASSDNIVGIALRAGDQDQEVDIMLMIDHMRPMAPGNDPGENDPQQPGD